MKPILQRARSVTNQQMGGGNDEVSFGFIEYPIGNTHGARGFVTLCALKAFVK